MTSCVQRVYKGAAASESESISERCISSMKQAFKSDFYGKKEKILVLIRQKAACPRSVVENRRHRGNQWKYSFGFSMGQ